MIDCHSHISFLSDDEILRCIQQKPNGRWFIGGYDSTDWQRQLDIKAKFPQKIATSFGIHPWVVHKLNDDQLKNDWAKLELILPQADMLGETGLDFFIAIDDKAKNKQKKYFRDQLMLAADKPLVLHIVRAHGPALEILRNHQRDLGQPLRGLVHRFNGTVEVAREYRRLGLFVSIGPDILKKNATKLEAAVAEIEIDHLLVESDSPESHDSGEDPIEKFYQVAEKVAQIRQIEVAPLLEQVAENAHKLLS